jgi:hypothetical protein
MSSVDYNKELGTAKETQNTIRFVVNWLNLNNKL